MSYLAPNVRFLPNLADACDRITARAKAENEAEERRRAVERARQIIRNPKGYTDAHLRTACGFYMTHGDGGPDYLDADKHLFAIEKRRKVAVNHARCRAALAAVDDRAEREERARIAAYRKRLGAVTVGILLAMAAVVMLHGLGVLL